MSIWLVRNAPFAGSNLPRRIMGIVNATPDSFSDGGRFASCQAAVDHALRLEDEGADIVDLGGESSRPFADPVPLDEERRRVLPVLEALERRLSVPISIDTMKPQLAREAVDRGAEILNDIGGLRERDMVRLAVEKQLPVVVMHMPGTPQTMQVQPHYDDVVVEVKESLERQLAAAHHAGLDRRLMAVDPGIGFGKKFDHNLRLLREIPQFASLGCALLIGLSRKGFLGRLTGRETDDRLIGSVVGSLAALYRGAHIVRVHDVGPMRDAIRVWESIADGSERGS